MNHQDSDQNFMQTLQGIAEHIQPDPQFVATLDKKLRTAKPTRHWRISPHYAYVAVVTVAVFLGMIIGTFTVPSIRLAAQELIDSLFQRAKSDTANFPSGNSSTSTAQTFATIAQAQTVAQFTAREPKQVPASFKLQGIVASADAVTFIYATPGRKLTISEQTRKNGWQDDGLVGVSAKIVPVNMGVITGEYVEGEWIVPSVRVTSGGDNAQWRGDIFWRRLRWQNGDMLYEIVSRGGSSDIADSFVGKDEMIAIAMSIS